jgi:hypothetical protein
MAVSERGERQPARRLGLLGVAPPAGRVRRVIAMKHAQIVGGGRVAGARARTQLHLKAPNSSQ